VDPGDGGSRSFDLTVDRELAIPLTLQPGLQTVTLSLDAGNVRRTDVSHDRSDWVSFGVRSINLQTARPVER
jgi:hypothetical protein